MPTKGSTPYGVKTLLECMARAALLAQPEDISTFLTLYLKNMFRSRTEDGKDIKVVAFDYEEDWEKNILKKEVRTRDPEPSLHPRLDYEEELASLAPKLEESLAKTPVAPPVSEDTEDEKVTFDYEEDLEKSAPVKMTVSPVELSKPKPAGAKPLSGQQSLVPWRKTDTKEADSKQELERNLLNQQIGTEPPQESSSSAASPGTSASFRSPVEGTPSPGTRTTLSSLWFPMDEDFFAQTAEEKTLYGKQKIPSPVLEKKECIRTRRSSSLKIPNQENIGTQTVGVKPSSNESQPAKLRTPGVLSVRGQPDPKPSIRCARPLYPPTLRKSTSEIPKQVKKKSTKKPDKDFVCQDSECPYHRKPGHELAVASQLEPIETTSGSRGQIPDMSAAAQKLPKIKTPYRPKGGYLYDPELDTKKTRGSAKPVLHRPSSAESIFLIVKPPSLGSCNNAQAVASASTTAEIVPEVTPQFASFIKHRCMYLQDRNLRCLTPTMCSIKIPQGPIENLQSVRKMQSHLTQCNQLHEIRWI